MPRYVPTYFTQWPLAASQTALDRVCKTETAAHHEIAARSKLSLPWFYVPTRPPDYVIQPLHSARPSWRNNL